MGNRNRRLWPTNKLKRRLSLARPARPFPLTSQLRTRWFIPIALRTPSLPALSPLRPQGRACPRREYKNQLRSTTVSTPRLLMAAIKSGISHQSLFLESLIHLTYFPINFLFSLLRSFFLLSSSPALTLLSPDTSTRLFASDSRLVSYPRHNHGNTPLLCERSTPPRRNCSLYTLPSLCVCGCIIGTSEPPSRLFTAADYYSLKIS